jgi:DNA-binding transcriptional regulator YdaS (Cro superfamily)
MEAQSPLEKAIAKVKTQRELATRIGTSQQTVSFWVKSGKAAAEFVLAIERETGVSRHELRPDVFGPAPETVA